MKRRFTIGLIWLLFLLSWITSDTLGQENKRLLTVWLIPLELADKDKTMNFDEFNAEFSQGGWITVLNTTVPYYRDQLIAWNPQFAYPNFPIIKGQRETLIALRRFAQENGIHINIRFVWWDQAFDELKATTEGKQSPMQDGIQIAPDVVMTGSTWIGYFAKKGVLLPRGPVQDGLSWRDTPDIGAASLRYTTDLHLIFYWKRMSWPISGNSFQLESNSWDAILDSLSKRPVVPGRLSPPMAMPIALSYRTLHDYAPLIWAGKGRFIDKDSSQADLTSEQALAIPRKLMERAVQVDGQNGHQSLLAFPEMSHEEAVQHFLKGEYVAVIEPVQFFKRWRDAMAGDSLPKSFTVDQKGIPQSASVSFSDYAGVAAPPRTFIGGSDLIVTNRVKDRLEERELAFKLVRFLATDDKYSATLAELGTLPAQRQQYGIDILRASLKDKSDSASKGRNEDGSAEFAIALSLALAQRPEQEFPALAEWPEYMESREVLESIQRIWRRIGEGGTGEKPQKNLKAAAADAERVINLNFNWKIRLWKDIQYYLPIVLTGLITLITLLGGLLWLQISKNQERGEKIQAQAEVISEREERIQAQAEAIQEREEKIQALERAEMQERGKNLALRLYQAKMHDLTKINGTNVVELSAEVKRLIGSLPQATENTTAESLSKLDNLMSYGRYLAKEFTLHSSRLTFAICEEMEGPANPALIQEVINRAYEGAKIEFKAVHAQDAPAVLFNTDQSLEGWYLSELPASLGVVLQEWFYNCLKAIDTCSLQEPGIKVQMDEGGQRKYLKIISPLPISEDKSKVLSEPPSLYLKSSTQGLRLIRDILWYGFKSKATCQALPNDQTLLSIPVYLTRSI
jgi:ABC-type glycerol-3-phosphate transport system substrate-binding protein